MAGRIWEAALLTRPEEALGEAGVAALTQARAVEVAGLRAAARISSTVVSSKYARVRCIRRKLVSSTKSHADPSPSTSARCVSSELPALRCTSWSTVPSCHTQIQLSISKRTRAPAKAVLKIGSRWNPWNTISISNPQFISTQYPRPLSVSSWRRRIFSLRRPRRYSTRTSERT
jgi:hypothetical protein